MSFAERLKNLRKENNFTQEDLADKIHVSRQTISKWESGSVLPDIENLGILSKEFNVSIDYLISGTDISKPSSNKYLLSLGIILIGIILLIVALILFSFKTDKGDTNSSVIEITVHGFLLFVSFVLILFGIVMTYKSKRK